MRRLQVAILLFTSPVCVAGPVFSATRTVAVAPPRSVRLNTYHTWGLTSVEDHLNPVKLQQALELMAKHDCVVLLDHDAFNHETPGWDMATPESIKRLNPRAKVYVYYWIAKSPGEMDWGKSASEMPPRLNWGMPVPYHEIEAHDWWLHDGKGNTVVRGGDYYQMDFGKAGFKERLVECIKSRWKDRPVDGFIFDAAWDLDYPWWDTHPFPAKYPDSEQWFQKSYVPMMDYVYAELHKAGYKVVGGSADLSWCSQLPHVPYLRSRMDIDIYENWILNWDGTWKDNDSVKQRIKDFNEDPLECWASVGGLKFGIKDYDRKQRASLAMYYIAIPDSQDKRSYHNDSRLRWDIDWSLDIGKPAAARVKTDGTLFWSRKYTQGMVILNYEDKKDIPFKLERTYRDVFGRSYSGQIVVPAKTGLILKALP